MLNQASDVIGVSVATFRGGQNLNFAIPSNYLKGLLTKLGPAKPLSQAKSPKAGNSILADIGGRSRDGVTGGKIYMDYESWFQNGSLREFFRQEVLILPAIITATRKNVRDMSITLVIFNDTHTVIPVDVQMLCSIKDLFRPGLAKRVDRTG